MAHRTPVAAVSALFVVLAAAPVDTCECGTPPPLSRAARTETPFVFEGKAVETVERSIQTTRLTSAGGTNSMEIERDVVFEVKRAWNGVTKKRLVLAADLSSCMFGFDVDKTYVVFAWKNAKGALTTHQCSRTIESSKAADLLAHLGPGTVLK